MKSKTMRMVTLDHDVNEWVKEHIRNVSEEINNYLSKMMVESMRDKEILELKASELRLQLESITKNYEMEMLKKKNELILLENDINRITETQQAEEDKRIAEEQAQLDNQKQRSKKLYDCIMDCFTIDELKAIDFGNHDSIRIDFKGKLYKYMKDNELLDFYRSFTLEEIIEFTKQIIDDETN